MPNYNWNGFCGEWWLHHLWIWSPRPFRWCAHPSRPQPRSLLSDDSLWPPCFDYRSKGIMLFALRMKRWTKYDISRLLYLKLRTLKHLHLCQLSKVFLPKVILGFQCRDGHCTGSLENANNTFYFLINQCHVSWYQKFTVIKLTDRFSASVKVLNSCAIVMGNANMWFLQVSLSLRPDLNRMDDWKANMIQD